MKILHEIDFYKSFGTRLKTLRKSHKITQSELAKHLEISPTTLVNYENGIRKIPLDVAIQIAAFFKVSIDSIVMVHYASRENAIHWNDEFQDIVFTPDEIKELISFGKYILFKRNDD